MSPIKGRVVRRVIERGESSGLSAAMVETGKAKQTANDRRSTMHAGSIAAVGVNLGLTEMPNDAQDATLVTKTGRERWRSIKTPTDLPLIQHWTFEGLKKRVVEEKTSAEKPAGSFGMGQWDTTTFPISEKLFEKESQIATTNGTIVGIDGTVDGTTAGAIVDTHGTVDATTGGVTVGILVLVRYSHTRYLKPQMLKLTKRYAHNHLMSILNCACC